jgi:hypothetical protein
MELTQSQLLNKNIFEYSIKPPNMGVFCYIYLTQVFINMGKKIKVRLTEQELIDLITKQLTGKDSMDILKGMLSGVSKSPKTSDTTPEKTSGSPIIKSPGDFTQIDLNTSEGFKAYENISDKFIDSRPSNLLGINGRMLANAAKQSYNKFKSYVPPELALAQLSAEGGFSNNPKARPIRTKNPFNVGNVDSGSNVQHGSVESGIQSYYDLMAKNYLSGGKSASDLIDNFVNLKGQRYASSKDYENMVKKISSQVSQISQPIYASLGDKGQTGLA